MRRVHIQAVVQRERHRVVVQGRVRGRVVRRDGRVREPRDELLDVADALHARYGGAEGGVVPGGGDDDDDEQNEDVRVRRAKGRRE